MCGEESESMKPLSKKNPNWIEHYRYLELKNFCLQYPKWCDAVRAFDSMSKRPGDIDIFRCKNGKSPVERCAEAREFYQKRIEMIQKAAETAADDLAIYILSGVTTGDSYETVNARMDVPCCRETYYEAYRRFFYILNDLRENYNP